MKDEHLEKVQEIFSTFDVNPVNICQEVIEELITMQIKGLEILPQIIKEIREITGVNNIEARSKSIISSLYKALVNRKLDDFYGIRMILNTVQGCYYAKELLCEYFRCVSTKDYIKVPKKNGYRSIHLSLLTQDGILFEVQIRTYEMHNQAVDGDAAHDDYKKSKWGEKAIDIIKGLPLYSVSHTTYIIENEIVVPFTKLAFVK